MGRIRVDGGARPDVRRGRETGFRQGELLDACFLGAQNRVAQNWMAQNGLELVLCRFPAFPDFPAFWWRGS